MSLRVQWKPVTFTIHLEALSGFACPRFLSKLPLIFPSASILTTRSSQVPLSEELSAAEESKVRRESTSHILLREVVSPLRVHTEMPSTTACSSPPAHIFNHAPDCALYRIFSSQTRVHIGIDVASIPLGLHPAPICDQNPALKKTYMRITVPHTRPSVRQSNHVMSDHIRNLSGLPPLVGPVSSIRGSP